MTEREHEVRDGDRVLKFNGELLAESTSRRSGQYRWIEFKLYRTKAGAYVLSRIGNSIVYHAAACTLVTQYRLKPGPPPTDAQPCEACGAYGGGGVEVYPEKVRYWAQVMEQPSAVLEALTKYDDTGTRYLTLVAQRLLAEAAQRDDKVRDVYLVEHVA